MHPRELLIEPLVYMPPAQALEGLTVEAAHRHVSPGVHSIAEIVAHMTFWQDWFCGRCAGTGNAMPQSAAPGWPDAPDGSWPDLKQQFLAGLERAASCGDPPARLDNAITPAIEFPPLAGYTIRDALAHVANHNGHHLGQVVVLRQLLGLWPPPGGSYTW